jgi:hypothetical protein
MGMRTDCRHYTRRTSAAGEVVEACRLDAAPDAPYTCPSHCPLYEKVKVNRAGWTVGSLGNPEPTANSPVHPEAEDLFASLASEFDAESVARIEAEENRRRARQPWWKRRKR